MIACVRVLRVGKGLGVGGLYFACKLVGVGSLERDRHFHHKLHRNLHYPMPTPPKSHILHRLSFYMSDCLSAYLFIPNEKVTKG